MYLCSATRLLLVSVTTLETTFATSCTPETRAPHGVGVGAVLSETPPPTRTAPGSAGLVPGAEIETDMIGTGGQRDMRAVGTSAEEDTGMRREGGVVLKEEVQGDPLAVRVDGIVGEVCRRVITSVMIMRNLEGQEARDEIVGVIDRTLTHQPDVTDARDEMRILRGVTEAGLHRASGRGTVIRPLVRTAAQRRTGS